MNNLYLGLMSGTSMDGIDAVLVQFDTNSLTLVGTHRQHYPTKLQTQLRTAILTPEACGLDELGELDTWVGECFRDTALALIESSNSRTADIRAIGSHGQTVRHRPDATHCFTSQIGNPAVIAGGTGIDTIADFRRADVALGGQGAPLVPLFHDWLFRATDEHRVVLNIGGIANVTVLPAGSGLVTGFDTGPGNTLLDGWIRDQKFQDFDVDGQWAHSGNIDSELLQRLLADAWLVAEPPKSTGVEYFNLAWLRRHDIDTISSVDVQATLSEFTAASIARAIETWAPSTSQIFVCGGGAHNRDLLRRLSQRLTSRTLDTTTAVGLKPDWVEAVAFAWLAKRHVEGRPGNLPSVTGASRETVLGAHYPGDSSGDGRDRN
ncbi:MAG: anhydro-N-acetylmuramic acid kinase [Gammaproteobacteria bacterium]|nr:anhydro-N-acetylmuramic acid kinase [Gammaproteobacteria bacterium]